MIWIYGKKRLNQKWIPGGDWQWDWASSPSACCCSTDHRSKWCIPYCITSLSCWGNGWMLAYVASISTWTIAS